MSSSQNVFDDHLVSEDVKKSIADWSADIAEEQQYTETIQEHRRATRKRILFITILTLGAFGSVLFSLQSSPLTGNAFDCVKYIFEYIIGTADMSDTETFWSLYASPPVLGALIGGAGLAICGAVMQSVLRNPMADPYTTGISSGASFGAALAISSGTLLLTNPEITVVMAFAFSMIPVLVILAMSKLSNAAPVTIIMTGIGIMYVFNALTSLVKIRMGGSTTAALDNWLMGDVQLVEWGDLLPMLLIVLAGIIISMYLASKINILSTGDENALAMGVNADKLRIICMLLTAIVSAGVISFTGLIGFVGLVCPHIARMFVGADNKYLIPASAALGSVLMVVGHLVGKTIISPTLIPVGIIMSCIGGPVFIWLVIRKNKNTW